MANTFSNDQVLLTIPMRPDMELAAAKLVSAIANYMGFSDEQTERIQLSMIESCINAFEHSYNPDKALVINYIIRANELEFKITEQNEF